jgi:hypothetical protein
MKTLQPFPKQSSLNNQFMENNLDDLFEEGIKRIECGINQNNTVCEFLKGINLSFKYEGREGRGKKEDINNETNFNCCINEIPEETDILSILKSPIISTPNSQHLSNSVLSPISSPLNSSPLFSLIPSCTLSFDYLFSSPCKSPIQRYSVHPSSSAEVLDSPSNSSLSNMENCSSVSSLTGKYSIHPLSTELLNSSSSSLSNMENCNSDSSLTGKYSIHPQSTELLNSSSSSLSDSENCFVESFCSSSSVRERFNIWICFCCDKII